MKDIKDVEVNVKFDKMQHEFRKDRLFQSDLISFLGKVTN